jgi:hypothetical protein
LREHQTSYLPRRHHWGVDPTDLKRSAALDALERLDAVTWQMDIESFYAPLSETLMWITALADAMGKIEEPDYSGLAYARNCALHGFVIVSQVHEQGPREAKSPLLGDNPRIMGNATARIWGFTEDPEPHDPMTGRREPNRNRRVAYNERVARHAVFPMLDRVLLDLEVNIWISRGDPIPRREPRQATVPPGYIP